MYILSFFNILVQYLINKLLNVSNCAVDPPATPDSQHGLTTSNGFTEGETEYLQMARKGGGHSGIFNKLQLIKTVLYKHQKLSK